MRKVIARLNARLGSLNTRITDQRLRHSGLQSELNGVKIQLAELERIRESIQNMKAQWLRAEQADPSDE